MPQMINLQLFVRFCFKEVAEIVAVLAPYFHQKIKEI
jgi:hypothetical protein